MDQHGVWERIADSFDRSRNRTWPHVETFLDGVSGRVLDLMCGNGRHTRLGTNHDMVAADWSRPLVAKAAAYGHGVAADATRLPFADATMDACIYVAGLHGIPDAEGRAASLAELHRVLKPGATAQITVWSRDAPRFAEQGTPGEPLDVIIPWKSDGFNEDRTYHLYTASSLRAACRAAGFHVTSAFAANVVSQKAPDNLVIELRK